MVVKHFFDFAGIDVEAAGQDHVFGTINYVEVALLVHFTDVAGAHPAVDEDVGGLTRLIPVALHDIGAFYRDLSHAADGHWLTRLLVQNGCFDTRQGQADAAIPNIAIERVAVCDGRGLAQSVALNQPALCQFLPVDAHLRWQWRCATDAYVDRTQRCRVLAHFAHDGDVHSGNARKLRRVIAANGFNDLRRFELRQQNHSGSRPDRQVHTDRHTIHVEERSHAQH